MESMFQMCGCALPVLLCQVGAPSVCERQQEPERSGGTSEGRSRAVISVHVSRAHLHR